MKERIVHVLNSRAYAGAENVVTSIIDKMDESKEYEFLYVSLKGPIKEVLEEKNINYILIDKLNIKNMKYIIKIYKPTIIHAHDFTASIICSMVCKDIVLISHLHNNRPWIRKKNLKSIIYYLSSYKYKNILGVSNSIFDEYVFSKNIEVKSFVVGNPIDTFSIKQKSMDNYKVDKEYDFIYLGRLSEAKNPKRFIHIVNVLRQYKPDVKTAMIGTGELEDECLELITKLKLKENINMIGFLKNPYPIIKNSKGLCMTSKWEGYGMAAIEALALGVPVICTKVGGLKEIINNSCGRLCEKDNEFIEEMILLIDNKEVRLKKSKGAKIRAEKFDNIEIYIKNLKEIYKNK